ncbi:tetratricopeptide repeat protein [Croceicoccus sp. 1NDH52]|nr:tetratricopeptide repeat protein [Croceicoccus gelatinilyticus]MBS7669625.1 tetratricopeptide repeat protein [Croceicoccus gelatinilyticus]
MARWVLGGAALIAASAIGYSIVRNDTAPVPQVTGDQASVGEMIAKLEARLAESPDDEEGWRMLGTANLQTERYAEAATAFRRAATLDPDNAENHAMLGEALVLASRNGGDLPGDARAAFDRALSLDPADPRARYFRGLAINLEGKHEEAIEAWFDLLEDTPADAPYAAAVQQAITEVAKANDIDVAERLENTSLAPSIGGTATATAGAPGPSASDIAAVRAMSASEQQEMIRGMVDRLAARLEEDPLNPDGWIMLMRSRVQLGDMAGAREARDESLRLFRNDATTTRRLREAADALRL